MENTIENGEKYRNPNILDIDFGCSFGLMWKIAIFSRKKRKNWIGTISGTLSHNSQSLFISGMESFNEAGWWKLRHKKNPKQYYEYSKSCRFSCLVCSIQDPNWRSHLFRNQFNGFAEKKEQPNQWPCQLILYLSRIVKTLQTRAEKGQVGKLWKLMFKQDLTRVVGHCKFDLSTKQVTSNLDVLI